MSQLSRVVMQRFEDAKSALNTQLQISSFLAENGIAIESNKQICCPLHDDSTPSFSVNFKTNEWKCFGCPDGGHYIDLWMKLTNKRTGTKHTVFTAVEQLLRLNPDICESLGFKSIYQTYDDEFSLFRKSEQPKQGKTSQFAEYGKTEHESVYNFDEILQQSQEVRYVGTETIDKVMHKLKAESIDRVIEFIADCEKGVSDDKLISKYYHEQVTVPDFIETISADVSEEVTNSFLEALEDD